MNILSHVYKFYLLFCPWCFSIGVGYINVGECKGLLMLSRVLSFPFNRFFYVRLLLFSVSWPSNYSLPANPASRYTILLSFSCLSSPFPTSNTIYFWASFVSLRRKPQNKFFFLSFKKKKKKSQYSFCILLLSSFLFLLFLHISLVCCPPSWPLSHIISTFAWSPSSAAATAKNTWDLNSRKFPVVYRVCQASITIAIDFLAPF